MFDNDRDFVVVVLNMLSDVIEVAVVWSEAAGKCIGGNFTRLKGVAGRFGDNLFVTYDEVPVVVTSSGKKEYFRLNHENKHEISSSSGT